MPRRVARARTVPGGARAGLVEEDETWTLDDFRDIVQPEPCTEAQRCRYFHPAGAPCAMQHAPRNMQHTAYVTEARRCRSFRYAGAAATSPRDAMLSRAPFLAPNSAQIGKSKSHLATMPP